ncbi:unnamed protein product [Cylindrotheca closterium]|uniref:PDZ domain-containing protein n=1 Tax=Cylindrotheca closterium TaxID=2856 RepID=A0AAD2G1J9_9STRA|nr:unnamed protein product [Cylindrotheca closterium]
MSNLSNSPAKSANRRYGESARHSASPSRRHQATQNAPSTPGARLNARGNNRATDDPAREALAMAALAQAANASNKSPAEVAQLAKQQAQNLAKQQQQHQNRKNAPRPDPRKIYTVSLESVKSLLRSEAIAEVEDYGKEDQPTSMILSKLAEGKNDAFLMQLLLFEYYRSVGDLPEDATQIDTEGVSHIPSTGCEKMKSFLRKIESAYDSLAAMVPEVVEEETPGELDYSFETEAEAPIVVPGLLPPCISNPGDPTLMFFKACMGEGGENLPPTNDLPEEDLATEATDLDSTSQEPFDEHDNKHAPSVFSMFRRGSSLRHTKLGSVFGGRNRKRGNSQDEIEVEDETTTTCGPGEYGVKIEREMLGLTVENVLERTVVRTVLAGGPAKKAGAKVGSLIVKVGNIETKNLTHFETIDELRQSQRPLQLVLRQISDDSLRSAREEMGRLIRGSGFGKIIDGGDHNNNAAVQQQATEQMSTKPQAALQDKNIAIYTSMVRKRWIEAVNQMTPRSRKDEPILRVGEKLIWILTLFVVGLERESSRLMAMTKGKEEISPRRGKSHSLYHHTSKDYAEAANSVSRVLYDFAKKRMDSIQKNKQQAAGQAAGAGSPAPGRQGGRGMGRGGGRGGRGGRGRGDTGKVETVGDQLLLQIGDVLQRTRTFLADPTSPPAALLRGELIAVLCDILDADVEMKLAEEESVSSTQGGANTGPIADLGAAGSLLKLIILNCPIMRSPGCKQISAELMQIDEIEMKRRFGEVKDITADDYHRLHAGNRFLAVVHRLAASRSTSARITACSLGPVLWSHLDFPHQLQLRGVITRALHDVEVIVRKSTATVLHEIAELVFDPRCVPWLVLMCERAMTDPEPILRSAAMTLTWHLAEHLPNAFLGDASKGSRYLQRLPSRDDPIFADVYLLQCKLLPVATRLAEDRAPQVRLAVAAQCDRLCDALGDHWSSVIIDVLVALLTDSDERVRSEAVLCVPRLADIVLMSSPPGVIPAGESSVLDALLPAAIKLQKDASSAVRVALATAAGEMLTLLVGLQQNKPIDDTQEEASMGYPVSVRYQKRHIDERLVPLVQALLHDSDPEVTSSALRAVTNASRGPASGLRPRRNTDKDDDSVSVASETSIQRKDPVFVPVLSEEQVLRLLPTLSELANSKQWRVRQSAVEIVPALLGCTTKFETRAEISRMCVRLTRDKVDAVRRTAAECLCLGGGSLGSHGEEVSGEWITALVIPQIHTCVKHSDYRQRLLGLKMVEVILLNGVCPTKWREEDANDHGKNTPLRELLKVTLSLADDRIANVRLNVGKVLCHVIHVFGEEECRVVKYAILQQMKKERSSSDKQDRDVIYFGNKCLEKCKQKSSEQTASDEETRVVV